MVVDTDYEIGNASNAMCMVFEIYHQSSFLLNI